MNTLNHSPLAILSRRERDQARQDPEFAEAINREYTYAWNRVINPGIETGYKIHAQTPLADFDWKVAGIPLIPVAILGIVGYAIFKST